VKPSAIVIGPAESPFVSAGMVTSSAIVVRLVLITPYVSTHCLSPLAAIDFLKSVVDVVESIMLALSVLIGVFDYL